MDDGRLAKEMTLEGIAAQLKDLKDTVTETNVSVTALKASVTDLKADVTDLKADVTDLKANVTNLEATVSTLDRTMTSGFRRVDEQLDASKVRDEELRGLMKFSLEANVALRESMEAAFTAVDKKQDDEIGLVKDVIRDLSRR